MNSVNDRSRDIGPFVPGPDDDMLICRCEEITKGEIRKAVHDGMWTLTEIRRYLRTGMGLCQGQTCSRLVKGIVARELGVSPAELEPARNVGLDVRMIDGDEVRAINPYLSDEVICASWCPTDGHANPLTTTLGYYKMARRLGVTFITGEPVTELRVIKGKIRQVITPNHVYEGENVLVAAGLDSREILTTVGIDIPMTNSLLE